VLPRGILVISSLAVSGGVRSRRGARRVGAARPSTVVYQGVVPEAPWLTADVLAMLALLSWLALFAPLLHIEVVTNGFAIWGARLFVPQLVGHSRVATFLHITLSALSARVGWRRGPGNISVLTLHLGNVPGEALHFLKKL